MSHIWCKFRCLIPGFDGVLTAQAWKDALCNRSCTGAPVERYSIVKSLRALAKRHGIHQKPVPNQVEGGIQFTNHARHKYVFHHIFDRICDENGIEHRLTKVKHPWINGQSLPRHRPGSKRMNRTIKEATVKRYHHDSHDQLRQHLCDFVVACNFGRRLKTFKGLTPGEAMCKAWQNESDSFISNPHHQIVSAIRNSDRSSGL